MKGIEFKNFSSFFKEKKRKLNLYESIFKGKEIVNYQNLLISEEFLLMNSIAGTQVLTLSSSSPTVELESRTIWVESQIESQSTYFLKGKIISDTFISKSALIQIEFLDKNRNIIEKKYEGFILSAAKEVGYFRYIDVNSEKSFVVKIKTPFDSQYVRCGFRTWGTPTDLVVLLSKLELIKEQIIVSIPQISQNNNQRKNLIINNPGESYVAKLIKDNGIGKYEPHTMATALCLLQEVVEKKIFFDIGANIGIYSFFLASVLESENFIITGFEPTPNLATIAKAIASDNFLSYTVEQLAMGKQLGKTELYLSQATDSSNSLLKGFRPSNESIIVDIETVDNYCQRMGFSPSVIKMDTEGTEPNVLLGCSETISKNRPWIICEVLAGQTEKELMDIMKPYGYYYYHIHEASIWLPQSQIQGDKSYQYRDWLFAPVPLNQNFMDRVQELVQKVAH